VAGARRLFSSLAQEIAARVAADALPRMEHGADRIDHLQLTGIGGVSKHEAR
jgi:hypothetical protein